MDRAYSILRVKNMSEDDGFVYVEGLATTPTPDRVGDSVDPMGAKFAAPMPLLWQHDSQKPVGNVTFAEPNKKGIPFKAQIPKVVEPGTLKDRIDEAVQSLKYELVTAVSIGFRILENGFEIMDNGAWEIKDWEWLELSLVTIPANSEAVISAVKSADLAMLSATGRKQAGHTDDLKPGDSGVKKAHRRPILLNPRK